MRATVEGAFDGEALDLGGESRRRFLGALAAAGAGPAGLRRAVERVRDDVPDGVPVVWTRDRRGRPDRVRVVPEERHRRLSVYRRLDVAALRDRHAGVEGVTIAASGPDRDLALRVLVDRVGWAARRSLPGRVRSVPVVLAERGADPDGGGRDGPGDGCGSVCEEHIRRFYDPVPAGVQVKGREDGEVTRDGTLGLVAWNDDPAHAYECFVTAHHVVALDGGDPAAFLFQSGLHEGEPRSENVGRLQRASPLGTRGVDGAKYEVLDAVAADPLASAAEEQPAVSGSWDFAGLADATAAPGGSVPVSLAGRSTCWAESRCTHTERHRVVEHGAVVDPAVGDAGDSGGPCLDDDGKLVCTLSTGRACDGADHHLGPVGTTLLSRLGVALHPPTPDWPG